jgi:hypothetical protein
MNIWALLSIGVIGCGGSVAEKQHESPDVLSAGNGGQVAMDPVGSAGTAEGNEAGSSASASGASSVDPVGSAGSGGNSEEAGAGGEGGCAPLTVEEACPAVGPQQLSCGGVPDGCGHVIDCGECAGIHLCDRVQNVCLTCTVAASQIAQDYCKENEPEHPKAYQDCSFDNQDCVRADQKYWCCSF